MQPEHLSNPPIGVETPSESLDKEANTEGTFCPLMLHVGQKASSFIQFIERSNSNLPLQLEQKYS